MFLVVNATINTTHEEWDETFRNVSSLDDLIEQIRSDHRDDEGYSSITSIVLVVSI